MTTSNAKPCCPRFDPAPWDGKVLTWERKLFVRDRVTSFLHIPLNFGAVVRRNGAAIAAAGAEVEPGMILSDENSLWGADIYIEVAREVPQAHMTSLSGTFLTKAFEGPYRNMRAWVAEMAAYVRAQGHQVRKLYFYYTTCPRCAKEYGRNHVVILAQV